MATAVMRPPGPKGSWLGGNLPQFRAGRLEFLTRMAREYGDFVSLRFANRRIILVSDPDAIEHILVTAARSFRKHFALRYNSLVLGNGLLTSDGDFWLRQRRLAQPAFSRQRISAYGPIMVEHARRLLAGWRPGESVDILKEMERLTLGIAAKTLFDAEVADDVADVGEALQVAQDSFTARFASSLPPLPLSWPTPGNIRLWGAVRRLDAIIYRIIHERRKSGEDKGDLLSMLLQAQEEDGSRMTDRQLRDEAMTLFLAGHETTALTLSWAWVLLAQNPEAEARFIAEVREVLGDRDPTVDDLPRLRYAEWVLMETMRLYPAAWVFGREALEDIAVGGYTVPRGFTVLMSQWVMHRDPRFFEAAEKFRPQRWENPTWPKYAYIPFGGGPRLCIGSTFAMMETVLVLAAIARRYRFTLVPGHPIVPAATFTLRPQHGVRAVLTAR